MPNPYYIKYQIKEDAPREYIKKYEVREAQFLVWLLEQVEAKNRFINPEKKWVVSEIKEIKGEDFVRKHLSNDTIVRDHLF